MKKFVELAVTNRQTVKGPILFTVNALSATGEVLGKFVVKQLDLPNTKGVFVKYFLSKQSFGDEDAEDYSSLITLLQVIADDQDAAKEWLSILTDELLNDATIPDFYKFMLSQAVSIEDCSIEVVPIQFAFILTEMINKYLVNKGWFGVEVKVDSTLAEKVSPQFVVTPSKHAASTKVGSSWYVKN